MLYAQYSDTWWRFAPELTAQNYRGITLQPDSLITGFDRSGYPQYDNGRIQLAIGIIVPVKLRSEIIYRGIKSSNVDSFYGLYGERFSYKGHSWNNFDHKDIDGYVRNLLYLPSQFKGSALNAYTGNYTYTPSFTMPGQDQWHYNRHTGRKLGKGVIKFVHIYAILWSGYTKYAHFELHWYEYWEGGAPVSICDVYGSPLEGQRYASLTYYSKARAYRFELRNGVPYAISGKLRYTDGTQYVPIALNIDSDFFRDFLRLTVVKPSCDALDASKMGNISNQNNKHSGLPGTIRIGRPDFSGVSSNYNPNWHELAAEAYSNLGMADVNSVANISELLEMGAAVKSFVSTLKSIPSKKVKAVASAWLTVHYGFRLTIADIKELRKVLAQQASRRSSLTRCQSSLTERVFGVTYSCRYQVFYDQFASLDTILEELMTLSDAYLSFENAWDMIPWSFVLDWFVHLGDKLSELENWAALQQKHYVICCGQSILAEKPLTNSDLHLTDYQVEGTISTYRRQYRKELIKPSLLPSVTVNPFNHLVEGAALYISRM